VGNLSGAVWEEVTSGRGTSAGQSVVVCQQACLHVVVRAHDLVDVPESPSTRRTGHLVMECV
jgi:hypothetical protein